MNLSVSVLIEAPKHFVWQAITDFENCDKVISSIKNADVLHRPENGIVGLKWQETRVMFGKEATEIMWVTDAIINEYYCTRAESHGCIYLAKLSLEQVNEATRLSMSFGGEAQTIVGKFFSFVFGSLMKNSMKKELLKDLNDIKEYVENQSVSE